MKIKIKTYSFNKTAKTITFTDYATIKLESVLLITNVTQNKIIYNFANPALGGTVATNVLTLAYDTSAMNNNDKLMIMYEDDNMSIYDKLNYWFDTYILQVPLDWYAQLDQARTTARGIVDNYIVPSANRILEASTGWYGELLQARQTARDITDNKGIPALDRINGATPLGSVLLDLSSTDNYITIDCKGYEEIILNIDNNYGWEADLAGAEILGFTPSLGGTWVGATVFYQQDAYYETEYYTGGQIYEANLYIIPVEKFSQIRVKVNSTAAGKYMTGSYWGKMFGKTLQKVKVDGSVKVYASSLNVGSRNGQSGMTSGGYIGANGTTTTNINIYNDSPSELEFTISTDVMSAIDGFYVEHDIDSSGTWTIYPAPFTIYPTATGKEFKIRVPVLGKAMRFTYKNGPVATSNLKIKANGFAFSKDKSHQDSYGNTYIRPALLPTYQSNTVVSSVAATPREVWTFYGVANRKIQILNIKIFAFATTGASKDAGSWFLRKKSTVSTGGTPVASNITPLDSAFPASSATIRGYTANPSVGSDAGIIFAGSLYVPTISTVDIAKPIYEFDCDRMGGQPITLNSATEGVSFDLGGITMAGLNFYIETIYTENSYL